MVTALSQTVLPQMRPKNGFYSFVNMLDTCSYIKGQSYFTGCDDNSYLSLTFTHRSTSRESAAGSTARTETNGSV